jgi:hypothetical protein
MTKRWRKLFLIVAVTFLVTGGLLAIRPRGLRVTVTNRGPDPLSDVVVHVTGNSYRLGTLGVRGSRTVAVSPRGESGVELEFVGSSGARTRLDADGYFEAGYEGTIEIDLEAGVIVRNEHQIRLFRFY